MNGENNSSSTPAAATSPTASLSLEGPFHVESENCRYTTDAIISNYTYETTIVENGNIVKPVRSQLLFRTERKIPRVGVMLIGLGGNNGSTCVAGAVANQLGLQWQTKDGTKTSNYWGSLLLSSTLKLGHDARTGQSVYTPIHNMLPMIHPDQHIVAWGGWDINKMKLGDAMKRAKVLDYDLQQQLYPHLQKIQPLPSIYYPDFIAANQSDRADNLLPSHFTKQQQLEQLQADIRNFKTAHNLDKCIVVWTANTERFASVEQGVNDTAEHLLQAIRQSSSRSETDTTHNGNTTNRHHCDKDEISASTIFAVASILEQCTFINGSPQNTFVPGVIDLAQQRGVFIGGDDFKSGQTKLKSVLVDFLVSAGIKPVSIVSYNHLGNNDGMNLSAPNQFRSKEISKSNVVDDMVASNRILYPKSSTTTAAAAAAAARTTTKNKEMHHADEKKTENANIENGTVQVQQHPNGNSNGVKSTPVDDSSDNSKSDHPDHVVVIKYVPYVGDSKRAMDEYTSEIFMGGKNTIVIHNMCEDSLLATPLIYDLVILAELCERIKVKRLPASSTGTNYGSSNHDDFVKAAEDDTGWESFHPVLSLLSYMLKAPMVPNGAPVVNALFPQREAIVNVLRACLGLPSENYMTLEHRFQSTLAAMQSQCQQPYTNGIVSSNYMNGTTGGAPSTSTRPDENGVAGTEQQNGYH